MALLFGEYLKELIADRNINISSLARKCSLERTLLSKVLSGQRILPYPALDSLVFHLKLTPGEAKRLRAYYDLQFEKGEVSIARGLIDRMFANMANLNFDTLVFSQTKELGMDLEQYAAGHSIIRGETNVRLLLQLVLEEESVHPNAKCQMTVPIVSDQMGGGIDLLSYFLKSGGDRMEVEHILCFDVSRRPEEVNTFNLDYFCRLLPVCLMSGQDYHPYYYYGYISESNYSNPYSWFAVTHRYVVCVSEKNDNAMILYDPEQIAWYQSFFDNLKKQCYSLVQYTDDPLFILESYQKCTDSDGFYMIMDQPCFARYYSEDFVRTYMRRELTGYEQVFNAAMDRFSLLQSVPNFYTIFSETGLKRFMAEGTLDDYPTWMVAPFDYEERVRLMKSLAADIRTGRVKGRVVHEKLFPNYLSMCTTTEKGVGFFTTENFPRGRGICSAWIVEPGLCRAFHSWLRKLPESAMTLTAEETAAVLEKIAASKSGGGGQGL